MRKLEPEDILPIRNYSSYKLQGWIKEGLVAAAENREGAFYPLDSLLHLFDNSPNDFLEAVYRAHDNKLRFQKAVIRLIESLVKLVQTDEGMAQCYVLLPPLMKFVGKQNLSETNIIDPIKKMVVSPVISNEKNLLPYVIDAAVGLSYQGDAEKLLEWFVAHDNVRDEHIPLLLIALANSVITRFPYHLRKAAHRLERLDGNYSKENWKILEASLRKRIGSNEFDQAILDESQDRQSSRLAEVFGLKLRIFTREKGLF